MRAKYGSRLLALAFLSFFAVLAPQQAHADPTTIANQCQDGSFDSTFAQQRSAFAQQRANYAHNINTMFPLVPAMNQCVKNIMALFAKLPGLADPMNLAGAIIGQIINQVVGQVCSQVMGEITQVQSALTQMIKICLPLPKFNLKLDLPTFSAQSCSGGTAFSPLTGFTAPATSTYNQSQFQRH